MNHHEIIDVDFQEVSQPQPRPFEPVAAILLGLFGLLGWLLSSGLNSF